MKKFFSMAMAVVALSLSGCGGGELQKFVGVWNISGTTMMIFPHLDPLVTQDSANMTIIEGSDSDVVLQKAGCNLPASVNGETATIRSGFSCVAQKDGQSLTTTFTNGVVMVRDGAMTFDATGNVAYVANGKTLLGTVSVKQTATRLGK